MKEEIKKIFIEYIEAVAKRNAQSSDTGILPTFQGFLGWLMTEQINAL